MIDSRLVSRRGPLGGRRGLTSKGHKGTFRVMEMSYIMNVVVVT